jgi:hypothetical protein
MLADNVKDSGAVTMFPKIAEAWKEQTVAQSGWTRFERADFARLKQAYGVSWVVLDAASASGLECPYHNRRLQVCRIE